MPKNEKSNMRGWLVILLIAFVFYTMYKMNLVDVQVKELTMLEFYEAVDGGRIVEPVTRVVNRDEGRTYLEGEVETDEKDEKGEPRLGKDGKPVRARYRVTLVPGESENLMQDLLEARIRTEVKDVASAISPFMMQLIFFFGFHTFFYFLFF